MQARVLTEFRVIIYSTIQFAIHAIGLFTRGTDCRQPGGFSGEMGQSSSELVCGLFIGDEVGVLGSGNGCGALFHCFLSCCNISVTALFALTRVLATTLALSK